MAVIDLGKVLTEADIDSSLSGTSSNPVQNKVVKVALDGKVAEAPNDGKQYVRKNKAWSEVEVPDSQIQSDWTQTDTTKKDYIKNKPTIPTKVSELENDSGFSGATNVDESLSSTSTNPVQNKVINAEINNLKQQIQSAPIYSFEVDMTDGNIYYEGNELSAYSFELDDEGNFVMEINTSS